MRHCCRTYKKGLQVTFVSNIRSTDIAEDEESTRTTLFIVQDVSAAAGRSPMCSTGPVVAAPDQFRRQRNAS